MSLEIAMVHAQMGHDHDTSSNWIQFSIDDVVRVRLDMPTDSNHPDQAELILAMIRSLPEFLLDALERAQVEE